MGGEFDPRNQHYGSVAQLAERKAYTFRIRQITVRLGVRVPPLLFFYFKFMTLHELFPTIVSQESLKDNILEEEKQNLKNFNSMIKSYGNYISEEKYILNNVKFLNLKNKIEEKLESYLNQIYKPCEEVKIYITQSWITVTKPQGWHHQHKHPNSFLSGVFYLQVEKDDEINFYSDSYQQILLSSKVYDKYNSSEWTLNIDNYDLLIFPSSLSHSVKRTSDNSIRVSLAFNTFLTGKIGDENTSSGLILE
jgi:uncharacterized protein (TIGR02466 family)